MCSQQQQVVFPTNVRIHLIESEVECYDDYSYGQNDKVTIVKITLMVHENTVFVTKVFIFLIFLN